jgi:3-deoxy-alpha-D-manno-octulosonate 8-oxidase
MVKKNNIFIPKNLSKAWTEAEIEKMIDVTLALHHMWNHALGTDWKNIITRQKIKELYLKM